MSDIMPSPDELMRQHEHAALRDERDAALAENRRLRDLYENVTGNRERFGWTINHLLECEDALAHAQAESAQAVAERDEAIAERDAALADCSTAEGNLGAAMARANGLELALGRACRPLRLGPPGSARTFAPAWNSGGPWRSWIASKALAAILGEIRDVPLREGPHRRAGDCGECAADVAATIMVDSHDAMRAQRDEAVARANRLELEVQRLREALDDAECRIAGEAQELHVMDHCSECSDIADTEGHGT